VNDSPEGWSDTDLATAARRVLDDVHADKLRDVLATYEERLAQHRAETDLATLARAATYGMIDTLHVGQAAGSTGLMSHGVSSGRLGGSPQPGPQRL
jgi:hypothetical protein